MPRKVSPVPKGFRTVTPVLTVNGAAGAIEFYAYAFGAEERCRVYAADGVSIAHAELKIGNSLVIVSDEAPALGVFAPTTFGVAPATQHMYLADVDAVWARAVEAGATMLVDLADTYWGERFGKFVDPYGHIWSVAKRIESLSADEIAARAAALAEPEVFEPMVDQLTAAVVDMDETEAAEIAEAA